MARPAILRNAGIHAAALGLALALSPPPADATAGGPVHLGAFAMDATEVTIGGFRAFAQATGLVTAAEKAGGGHEWGAGWERRPGWTVYRPFGSEPDSADEPAVHVTWQEAADYCRWRGGRLPTAGEWRRAAYTEMREAPGDGFEKERTYVYPVGDAPDGMNTNLADPWPRHAPVGATRRGVNGLHDMGGNVWEWLVDRRGDEALTAGGSWWYGPAQTRADAMQWKPADFYVVYIGFRCAYDAR
ncbi:MAG: formylglycine-generating enzyme family protein [Enhydrobacter sp.]|nr:MAG: formylglycine-generating enzyme family protein [Enhydrobacter sp.]